MVDFIDEDDFDEVVDSAITLVCEGAEQLTDLDSDTCDELGDTLFDVVQDFVDIGDHE